MIEIKLGVEGKFLSGRSRVTEILSRYPNLKDGEDVTFDFAGVDVASQSFVSELLQQALRSVGSVTRLAFVNANDAVGARVSSEVTRLQNTSSS